MRLTLTEIEADVLRSLLDEKLADNRRHGGPDARPKLRSQILQTIREQLGPSKNPRVPRAYKGRPSPIFKEPSI